MLINGAGGGVGTFALQILKLDGSEVTVVDRGDKLDMLKSLRADKVIDYEVEDFTKTGHRYDLIIDVIGHKSIFDIKRSLSHNGMYVMIGGATSRLLQFCYLVPSLKERKWRS